MEVKDVGYLPNDKATPRRITVLAESIPNQNITFIDNEKQMGVNSLRLLWGKQHFPAKQAERMKSTLLLCVEKLILVIAICSSIDWNQIPVIVSFILIRDEVIMFVMFLFYFFQR